MGKRLSWPKIQFIPVYMMMIVMIFFIYLIDVLRSALTNHIAQVIYICMSMKDSHGRSTFD